MSRVLPQPPPNLADEITPLPTLSTDAAVEWLAKLGVAVTATYLTNARRRGEISAAILAGKRRYSTQSLWDFCVSRPTTTRRKPQPKGKSHA